MALEKPRSTRKTRPMAEQFRIHRLAAALVLVCAAIFPARALTQAKTSSKMKTNDYPSLVGDPAAIARGLIVYKDRCAICHFSESEVKKVGPGLKGIYKRGKFADGGKADESSIQNRILNGCKDMPPFKAVLNPNQLRDLITYLRTL
jgi:cytochrome c